jgi:endonuclease YncB( thermonuclease family)
MPRTFDFPTTLIERAVDGDSLEVTALWEMPFYIGPTPLPILLRVAGVDCWDSKTPRGAAAKARTAQLCEGRTLHVQTFGPYTYGVGTRARLGEWVGDVLFTIPQAVEAGAGDRRLSDILLAEGLALPYDGKGRRPTLGLPGTWPVPA